MKTVIRMISVVVLMIALSGCGGVTSALNATKNQQSSEKAMVVFDIPVETDLAIVKKGLKEAIAYRSQSFQEKTNFLPAELPNVPLAPDFNGPTMFSGGLMNMAAGNPMIEMMKTNVTNSYYSLSGNEEFGSVYAKKTMAYVGALYPSKQITRVYLIVYFQEGTNGITGAIAKAMADGIVGQKGAIPFMLQVKEKFLEHVPGSFIIDVQPAELSQYGLTKINRVEKITE